MLIWVPQRHIRADNRFVSWALSRWPPTNSDVELHAAQCELRYLIRGAAEGGIISVTPIGIKGENLLDDDVRNSASFKKDRCERAFFADVKLN